MVYNSRSSFRIMQLTARHVDLEQSKTKAQAALVTILTMAQITELKLLLDMGLLLMAVGIMIIFIGNKINNTSKRRNKWNCFKSRKNKKNITHRMRPYPHLPLPHTKSYNYMYNGVGKHSGNFGKLNSFYTKSGLEQIKKNKNELKPFTSDLHVSSTSQVINENVRNIDGKKPEEYFNKEKCDEIDCNLKEEETYTNNHRMIYSMYDLEDVESASLEIDKTEYYIDAARIRVADTNMRLTRFLNYIRIVEEGLRKSSKSIELSHELTRAQEELMAIQREKVEVDGELRFHEVRHQAALIRKDREQDEIESEKFSSIAFWQHFATYLLYFIGLMNIFITTFGISGSTYFSTNQLDKQYTMNNYQLSVVGNNSKSIPQDPLLLAATYLTPVNKNNLQNY
ncbi:hypothetical protein A3Q56_00693 [Intoshia linei]|uniref:Uncharacterized protein n=1 Tax=Intoshia linei TaxID=1819745 RepID=A0A177BBE2_9BILA|nr:hypothetical protein A3Q56_00693 [Intoshia linei]